MKLYSYEELKKMVADIIDGENVSVTIEDLINYINNSYEAGKITGHQYDDLFRYVQDFEEWETEKW